MRPLRRLLADAALALAATLAWTWPLAPRLGEVLRDRYDGRTQAWVVSWVAHALRTSPLDVFQANAFAPARDVLAFSEPLVGYGAVAVPFSLLGLGPVALLNLICILAIAFGAFSVEFMRHYWFHFEVATVLLLVGMIAAWTAIREAR